MKRVIDRIFRNADEMVCIHMDKRIVGRGVITALSKSAADCCTRTEIGNYTEPLHLFMGNIEGMEKGDVLTCGTREFKVLNAETVEAFGKLFCIRATLEDIGV